ncbi:MAG: helix-turn-helix domain-containing protein, partial [Deltaproteobacteria bacterium]|nr:helix-turn-helix domain-containing protein [Deltaproteobacteria bacterium]
MPLGRPIPPVTLDARMREQLQAMTRSRSLSQALAQRARIILLAADGLSNSAIAAQLGLSRPTVGKWRQRFLRQGLMGLYEEARPGAPGPSAT